MSKVNFTSELSMLLAKPIWSKEDRMDCELYCDKNPVTTVEQALQYVARQRLINEDSIVG